MTSTQADTTDVKVYPDVQDPIYNSSDPNPLYSSFSSVDSSFAEQMPPTSDNYLAEAAYDMWLNNWDTEVMVWNDNHGQQLAASGDTLQATMTSGGQTWQLWTNGTGIDGFYIFVPVNSSGTEINENSGTVNLNDFVTFLVNKGFIPTTTTYTAIDYGWEISSTNNVPLNFAVSNFSVTLTKNS